MPTFTAITLDRFLETRGSESSTNSVSKSQSVPNPNSNLMKPLCDVKLDSLKNEKKSHWAQISPPLYATPITTPIPDSPSSFPPSPYIINHKRRGPRLLKTLSHASVQPHPSDQLDAEDSTDRQPTLPTPVEDGRDFNGFVDAALGRDGESSDYYDPQESMSYVSNTDVDENAGDERAVFLNTPMGEYYDAWEELSSEGGQHTSVRNIEAELSEMRLSVLMEIEKRRQAEEALNNMKTQWERIARHISFVGLTLPQDPNVLVENDQSNADIAEDLCRQMYLARSVSESLGRGTAKAELEIEMEAQIESKNFEIARLCDRLHYYEAMNREMSQRNQETIEMARRDRQKKKIRQKWYWGLVACTIMLGVGVLASSYKSTGKGSSDSIGTGHSQRRQEIN